MLHPAGAMSHSGSDAPPKPCCGQPGQATTPSTAEPAAESAAPTGEREPADSSCCAEPQQARPPGPSGEREPADSSCCAEPQQVKTPGPAHEHGKPRRVALRVHGQGTAHAPSHGK